MASNLLEGPIPLDIESLNALQYLDLSDNKLSGRITLQIGGLSLYQLDLSHNILQGVKPSQFESLTQLNILNLSIYSNKDLCGSIQGFLPCPSSPSVNQERNSKVKHNLLVFILVPTLLFFVTTFALVIFILCRKYRAKALKHDPNIIKATEEFDIKYCIERFLTEIRHKNIVTLHGFCLHNRCMLVYEYMEKGNLFYALALMMKLWKWIGSRVNIVKGVAHALSYMHHDYNPPIVHRDISSNNILLNSELEAFIVDFGTARFLTPDSSNQTVIVGTYGYIAPVSSIITLYCVGIEKIDVMGKHLVELLSLLSLSSSRVQNFMLNETLDPRLSPLTTRPKARPTIKLVSQEFLHVKYPIAMPLHKISLIKLKNHEIFMRDESHNK
ncbi:hypothetical protein ES319_D09G022900v1 [Gossypium barbadense]|uniref:non-specific serine/threonine protein kinase n=2 Tax=Gossypium TaxID=3633 RepID=A0A5J5PY82_GOSBA|nr:hypothetical protein ES319_D09G022900v1 [Gossypium barbadense]TYG52404.1 hypothetical protein ES288_D09G025300v1 [Gossypium darwinii]